MESSSPAVLDTSGLLLAKAVQAATGDRVSPGSVDECATGDKPAAAARERGIASEVVKLSNAPGSRERRSDQVQVRVVENVIPTEDR